MINNNCCVNSRKVVVLFWNTTTRRKPYYIIQYLIHYHVVLNTTWKQLGIICTLHPDLPINYLQSFTKIHLIKLQYFKQIYPVFTIVFIYLQLQYVGVYLHISQYSFYIFCLDVFNTPNISLSFLIHYFSIIQITFFQFLPFSLNPSKSPLFLHFHYFSPISLKKHYVVSDVVQLPYLSHF